MSSNFAVRDDRAPLTAILIGTGFAGVGMAVALRQAGIHDFLILEKSHDVGGVWRDNSYPGAACDVPSHLYSFSFEPNPDWSRVFSPQPEIYAYLQRCAAKYQLAQHTRYGSEVAEARYDEQQSLWRVVLTDGSSFRSRLLISATGQLSRPAYPKIKGMETFQGPTFHSAHWDHDYALSGKRVAVVGTGASALQFVPAIADKVAKLTVFQRSPAYIMPRPDRAYAGWEKALFRAIPGAMKLHRASIYLRYESRALAFTRFKGLMQWAVGRPFRALIKRQVPDAALRSKLMPDYPIGCKRILLSSEYLAAMSKPNVHLETCGIKQISSNAIETVDGTEHAVDAIIYGTGFAATEFLSPMRITGRGGVDLNQAWQGGARAYLGMTVPGFPNFFMLYGPNTNLGHNSIVYMIESQIRHVIRCLKAMQNTGADTMEVDTSRYTSFNAAVQQRLLSTVWNGCKSWYVDANGHNSTNWPGFTLSYRWLTRFSGLNAYRMTRSMGTWTPRLRAELVLPPHSIVEALNAGSLRVFLRGAFRTLIGPPFGPGLQRLAVAAMSSLMPGVSGVMRYRQKVEGVTVEVLAPLHGDPPGAILFLHGGAFCVGSPGTHRSITTRLARDSGLSVWVPDYRLAPEHPYPAGLQDALSAYRALREQGIAASRIVIAGDSAGGALALALALTLKDRGEPAAAGLMLISPVTDPTLQGESMQSRAAAEPMIRRSWLEQALHWYRADPVATPNTPLQADLRGLPPMFIQAGEDEVLLSDATSLAESASRQGVPCRLEVHAGRWHVFQLHSFYLASAREAVRRLALFAREQVQDEGQA
ncbi:flavin-containing monooxygenase [Rhodoferax mekongensis]|uniref:flavin-containing monooxygenase n=1 Tax=Rhodoferax mekongensis TaxID=3068341 RepID=UPI0028BD2197|nr:alpha/beta hydrolase fold domain-containing protein [Rhodoferax sp. TBRC 17199]MDT7516197.1 alpha/beta hydrolase fold domain-containing protein [Rhodoferax sp. TBRC 17199]